jgi:peptide/nickel transport system ATP-binding protein
MTVLLEARGASHDFVVGRGLFTGRRLLRAVVDLDITVDQGDALGIVGESGSGKSTFGKMLLGLLPPTRGAIRFAGTDVSAIDRRSLARKIQPVFQDPYSSLNPRRTVAAIVASPLTVLRLGTPAQRRVKALAMLDRVGLPGRYADVYPGELSGGQRQRVAIARALAVEPQIVLLDEPTSALDVSVQSQILNLLSDLKREFGLTYIFISHNLAVIEHIATQVAVMYLGRIVEFAPRDTLFSAPRHPYTQALLASVLTPEPGLGVPDIGLGLAFPNPLDPPPGCGFHPRCPQAGPRCRAEAPGAVNLPHPGSAGVPPASFSLASPEKMRAGRPRSQGERGGLVACHIHDGGTALVA